MTNFGVRALSSWPWSCVKSSVMMNCTISGIWKSGSFSMKSPSSKRTFAIHRVDVDVIPYWCRQSLLDETFAHSDFWISCRCETTSSEVGLAVGCHRTSSILGPQGKEETSDHCLLSDQLPATPCVVEKIIQSCKTFIIDVLMFARSFWLKCFSKWSRSKRMIE